MAAPIVKNHPSDHDIVCMRGKAYWNHPGNIAYRHLIEEYKHQYAHAGNSKFEKSLIVTEIIELAKERNGRFVKKTKKGTAAATTPIWVECSDDQVREKVSQSLRDGLSTMYKSATSSKKHRREKVNSQLDEEIERVIFSNTVIADKIAELNDQIAKMKAGNHPCNSKKMQQQSRKRRRSMCQSNTSSSDYHDDDQSDNNDKQQHDACDRTLSRLFDETNVVILETIKTDPFVLSYSWVQQ